MFSQTRSSDPPPQRGNAGFADTQFLHDSGDEDYSGFAPTQVFEDAVDAPVPPAAGIALAAAASSQSALARAAAAPAPQPFVAVPVAARVPASAAAVWATSSWSAAQEARAHEAAHQARAVIAAQRRGEASTPSLAGVVVDRGGVGRLLRALLPLFVGVTVTMALISAVLPLLDKL